VIVQISLEIPNTLNFLAWRVQPRNYLLFACHLTNATAQTVQDIRFANYWHFGGREQKLGLPRAPEDGADKPTGKVTEAVIAARSDAKKIAEK
jgi:hypothetical protein